MDRKEFLEKYRPVLNFSIGENFFPMDVTKFIDNSKLIEMGDRKKTDLWMKNAEDYFKLSPDEYRKMEKDKVDAKQGNDPEVTKEKCDRLGEFTSGKHYLQYVEQPWYLRVSWLHLFVLVFSFGSIVYGLQTNQVPLLGTLLSVWQALALLLIITPLGIWCLIGGKKEIYLAMSIILFSALFYSDKIGIGAGYVATSLLAFYSITSVLKRFSDKNFLSILGGVIFTNIINLLLISLTIPHLVRDNYIFPVGLGVLIIINFPIGVLIIDSYWDLFTEKIRSLFNIPVLEKRFLGFFNNLKKPAWPTKYFGFLDNFNIRALGLKLLALTIKFLVLILAIFLIIDLFVHETPVFVTQTLGIQVPCDSLQNNFDIQDNCDEIVRTITSVIMCALSGFSLYLFFTPPQQNFLKNIVSKSSTRISLFILVGIALWWFGSIRSYISFYREEILVQTLIFYPVFYLIVVVTSTLITIGLVGGKTISWFMDIQSLQSDTAADAAKIKYDASLFSTGNNVTNKISSIKILSDLNLTDINKVQEVDEQLALHDNYFVYGRVVSDERWAVLQYHYFYAFNDYRSTANGVNNHEGDWEMVAVFLENKNSSDKVEDYIPTGVACSQHENGQFIFWESDALEKNGSHPIIYVALGSHANYFKASGKIPTSFQFSGTTRRIVSVIDDILKWFHGGEEEEGLPPEKVDGKNKFNDMLNANPTIVDISTDEPGWIKYRGLWGQQTYHPNESGPTGPKWVRMEDVQDGRRRCSELENAIRLRWGLHCWKDILLLEMATSDDKPLDDRIKALKTLGER